MEEGGEVNRRAAKRHMGMAVVAVIVAVMLALGYYYTKGQRPGASTVVVAVRGYLSVEQKDALSVQFNGYAPDSGEAVDVALTFYEFPAAGGAETSEMLGSLLREIQEGPADLYLMDGYVYGLTGNDTLFENLSERYPNDPAVTERHRYTISQKPFLNAEGLENLPETALSLRSATSGAVNKNAQTLDEYSYQCSLLDNIVNSEPPDDFAVQSLKK